MPRKTYKDEIEKIGIELKYRKGKTFDSSDSGVC